jgi:N-lysine methyltransferase SETD6
MLITAFCLPAEKFSPSKLSKHVRDASFALSEASLLQTSITNRLGDFKSSLQADFEILGKLKNEEDIQLPDGVCRKRYEMAVQVRRGEKEILHHVLQLIQDFVAEQTRQMARDSAKRKWTQNDTAASNKKKATHK